MTALARRAGILCNDERFRLFVALRITQPGGPVTATAAAEYLRGQCGITSRRALDTDPDAADRFAALCTDFDAWRGRIATQR
ncbi:hypothetical protein [Pararhodobacter zhoushanensis]|uniref:hypothetical protein n=1 Tax=Pararhodobacter zhoushanensis TaxID=2479545 RepID=UPI000F8E519A|nr:hypothetical protein [Pararhodobacter zhoushanensis]